MTAVNYENIAAAQELIYELGYYSDEPEYWAERIEEIMVALATMADDPIVAAMAEIGDRVGHYEFLQLDEVKKWHSGGGCERFTQTEGTRERTGRRSGWIITDDPNPTLVKGPYENGPQYSVVKATYVVQMIGSWLDFGQGTSGSRSARIGLSGDAQAEDVADAMRQLLLDHSAG